MKIRKEIVVNAAPQEVYASYVDIKNWKEVLEEVVAVDVHYDDKVHQEFSMTVQKGNSTETVRSVRFCFPTHSVEIFQTQPPPLLEFMNGVWTFNPCANGTLLAAERSFRVKEGSDFDVGTLELFLEKNLASFKNWIENHALCER